MAMRRAAAVTSGTGPTIARVTRRATKVLDLAVNLPIGAATDDEQHDDSKYEAQDEQPADAPPADEPPSDVPLRSWRLGRCGG